VPAEDVARERGGLDDVRRAEVAAGDLLRGDPHGEEAALLPAVPGGRAQAEEPPLAHPPRRY
jgi:hypothetical protein